ncbi:MAG: ketoacyl-ACP synthase III [Deltaproteobacteria bacterium]|nr:ketoacyl-ACP synthase III [Deltaproteobacteria bacterium]MBW1925411.1 ketoacyl-ACP synthase III [Deltaproteobacteria bacterium]MBW1949466.1 ketoacyl-ACP synthase III [Deltaproteobacteria bacterium]MBW2007622.1 ketoacyl-ACP synthase III [Deltaproteobacteria bacterium]MBW2347332.1 ketoacyl-ACP synthase III [Deltaproteobacteria bacterium]
MWSTVIKATGSHIPSRRVTNEHFVGHEFYGENRKRLEKTTREIIKKFREITGIRERRYVPEGTNTSDIAYEAAKAALEGRDAETLDYIIVAHNLGDLECHGAPSDMIPTLAARVKRKLGIRNPYTVAFDLPFGCPGWLQGVIMAHNCIRAGDAKRALVIGAETLSRLTDPHDMDTMIYADGAGATLLERSDAGAGILSHVSRSDTLEHAELFRLGPSYSPSRNGRNLLLKMNGHDIYRYAVSTVPLTVKEALDKAGLTLTDVKKVLIHQANEKMDQAILKRLFKLYGIRDIPEYIMPMTISWLGNSSVATLPTLLDLVQRGRLDDHRLKSGDVAVFASVGAGMNINTMVYRMP